MSGKLGFLLIPSFYGLLAVACPDFSGTYQATYIKSDSRKTYTLKLEQTACNRVDGSDVSTYKDGSAAQSIDWYYQISPTAGEDVWYWDQNTLVYLEKDQPCNNREVHFFDANGNLKIQWRSECPGKTPGAWQTNSKLQGNSLRRIKP